MVKVSINRYISQRIETMRKEIEATSKRLRDKTLKNLEEIFTMAGEIAKGEIKHQRINGKMVRITLNQRRRWLRVAAHVTKNHQNHCHKL